MAIIAPFRGYRFDTAKCGDMGRLISPPYDVIDPALRDTLWRLSDHNISRVTKADRDESASNPYEKAGALWQQWLDEGALRLDSGPAMYVYEQYFEAHGRHFHRTALIARMQLERSGNGVLPHENTLAGPRADRLMLTRATRTHFGLVFRLYSDPAREVDAVLDNAKRERPLAHAAGTQDLLHRLWAITDAGEISKLQHAMEERNIVIADGHHRYETALAYMSEHPESDSAKYGLVALVNTSNPGMVIPPFHRCIKGLKEFDRAAFLAAARRHFDVRTYPGDTEIVRNLALREIRALQDHGRHAFALLMNDQSYHVLTLRDESAMDDIAGYSAAWRHLDVTILHRLLLEQMMGITAERLSAESNVEYVHDVPHMMDAAAERVRSGECQALFLLNPTRAEEVEAVAANRERMPQKSTFFYPKMFTGLVMYRMDDAEQR